MMPAPISDFWSAEIGTETTFDGDRMGRSLRYHRKINTRGAACNAKGPRQQRQLIKSLQMTFETTSIVVKAHEKGTIEALLTI